MERDLRAPLPAVHVIPNPIRTGNRRALSLVELVVFIAIFAILVGSVIPLMSMAIDHYFQQRSMSIVENNAVLLMNDIVKYIRSGERILKPEKGDEGSVLAIQTGLDVSGPLIIGVSEGMVAAFSGGNAAPLSTSEVEVENLTFRNSSTSDRENVDVSFALSVTSGTPPRTFRKQYAVSVSLFDITEPRGNPCACETPHCSLTDTYTWQSCTVSYNQGGQEFNCYYSTGAIVCDPLVD